MEVHRYWQYAEAHKRRATVDLERFALQSYRNHGGSVQEWHLALVAGGLSPVSANVYLRHLRSVYKGMQRLGIAQDNPAEGVLQYKLPWRNPDFLTERETSAMLAGAQAVSARMHWCLCLCVYAGLRKGEAVHARWDWFDFEQRLLTVRASHGFQPKSGRERVIPLNSYLVSLLGPYALPDGFLFDGRPGSLGKSKYRYDPAKGFCALRERVQVPRATFILLRHTFASRLVQRGVSIFKVCKWLGHASVRTTEQYYAGLQAYDSDIDLL